MYHKNIILSVIIVTLHHVHTPICNIYMYTLIHLYIHIYRYIERNFVKTKKHELMATIDRLSEQRGVLEVKLNGYDA